LKVAEVRCLRCNRPLSNPVSVRRRYGPTCWKRVWREVARNRMRELVEVFKAEPDGEVPTQD